MNNSIKDAYLQARKKGLRVMKNTFLTGWSIELPNGSSYHAKTDHDMITYIQGY